MCLDCRVIIDDTDHLLLIVIIDMASDAQFFAILLSDVLYPVALIESDDTLESEGIDKERERERRPERSNLHFESIWQRIIEFDVGSKV